MADSSSIFEHLITHYRWFFVIFFLMPMSLMYETYLMARNLVSFYFREKAPEKHAQRVQKISDEIKSWVKDGCKTQMCTARPGWQAMSLRAGKYKKTFKNINLDLHDVLEIDVKNQTCRVEPMVTMGQITHSLLPLGWTLPVLPELDDLTVGGLVAGVGIETSSHKYGLFQHICTAFEIVLPDGSVEICTKERNPDLFYSIPWSHGTLGFVVSVEIRIVPMKPFVDLTYIPFKNKDDAVARFIKDSKDEIYDFVECLAYSTEEYVVMVGNMTSNQNAAPLNAIGLWHKEWFFMHVKKYLSTGKEGREIVPLRDYYHRHTKSLFWEIQDIVPFGNNIIFRWLFGWMMPPKPSLLKLTQTEALRKLYELHHVVQDMLVPIDKLGECLSVFDKEIDIYPLWLCPFKVPTNAADSTPDRGFIHPSSKAGEMFVDVGAYGNPRTKVQPIQLIAVAIFDDFKAAPTCRRLEDYVRSVDGYQMMYADSYMTKEEFREMFDHSLYDRLRNSIPNCLAAFPEVYDKVSKQARI